MPQAYTDVLNSVVIIAEDNPGGHRLNYVRMMIVEYSRNCLVVFSTTQKVLDSPEFRLYLSGIRQLFVTRLTAKTEVRDLEKESIRIGSVAVVIPEADGLLAGVYRKRRWLGSGQLCLLIMRENRQDYSLRSFFSNSLKRILIKILRRAENMRIVTLAPAVSWSPDASFKAPDPVEYAPREEEIEKFREQMLNSGADFWYGIVGALSGRKNISMVGGAILEMGRKDVGFLLAGRVGADVQDEVESTRRSFVENGVPFIAVDRLLSEGEIDAVIAALDCVVLAHSNEGPSGILGKAVAAKTLVVAAGARSLRADCKNLPQSSLWAPLAKRKIVRAMLSVQTMKPVSVPVATPQNFASAVFPESYALPNC